MTDTVEAIVAEMRRGGGTETGWIGIDTARSWADRLQSAHDAEVGALRAEIAEVREAYQQRTRDWYSQGDAYDATRQRAESAESRLREAERDARRYRWLRERHDAPGDDFAVFKGVTIVGDLDAAIDRAMEGEDG